MGISMQIEQRYAIQQIPRSAADLLAEGNVDEAQISVGTCKNTLQQGRILTEILRGRIDIQRIRRHHSRVLSGTTTSRKHGRDDKTESCQVSQVKLHLPTILWAFLD